MKRWEYHQLCFDKRNRGGEVETETLNALGREGWEAIAVSDLGREVVWTLRRERGPLEMKRPMGVSVKVNGNP